MGIIKGKNFIEILSGDLLEKEGKKYQIAEYGFGGYFYNYK